MNFNILKEKNIEINSILDIGAHSGHFTNDCKKNYPNAYYYLIEGNPISDNVLKTLGVDYKICYLSDKIKDTVLYKTRHNEFCTGDSLYRENTHYYGDDLVVEVPITTETLDNIFTNNEIFDFIKIDTQGSEIDIIKGGIELCKRAKVFLLEASVLNYNEGGPLLDDVIEFMKTIGFDEYEIVYNIPHPDDHSITIQHDILFFKSK